MENELSVVSSEEIKSLIYTIKPLPKSIMQTLGK